MNKRIKISLIILSAIAICFVCSKRFHHQDVTEEYIPFVQAIVIGNARSDNQNLKFTGEVHSKHEVPMGFQLGGRIIKRNINLGDTANKGDVLFQIDPDDARQAMAANQAQLAAARSQYILLQDNVRRYRKLYESGVISKVEFDQRQTTLDLAQAQMRQAYAQLQIGSNQLSYCQLKASEYGVVTGIYAEQGQMVGAGQPVMALADPYQTEIAVDVPESRLNELDIEAGCGVTFWALPGVVGKGNVSEVSPMADVVTRSYKVKVSLSQQPANVKLGMTATVSFKSKSASNLILVPISAIYQFDNNNYLWLVKSGRTELTPVTLGDTIGGNLIQIAGGIKSGDTVVTAGVHKLGNNQKVKTKVDTL